MRYARQILVSAVTDYKAAPLVRYVTENWSGKEQAVGKALSVGCVGAVWTILMTVVSSVENGTIRISKRSMLPEKIEFESEKFTATFNINSATPVAKPNDCAVY